MKERPILFSGPMVRAILNGSKTQTRRVVKPLEFQSKPWFCSGEYDDGTGVCREGFFAGFRNKPDWRKNEGTPLLGSACYAKCPYGKVGDRLWVRETWQRAGGGTGFWYAATDSKADNGETPVSHWKPSIHMPRAASRITLEITAVRVERLQDISERDAQAEGCGHSVDYSVGRLYKTEYCELWEAINGHQSWDANPWVWVIEFKKIG